MIRSKNESNLIISNSPRMINSAGGVFHAADASRFAIVSSTIDNTGGQILATGKATVALNQSVVMNGRLKAVGPEEPLAPPVIVNESIATLDGARIDGKFVGVDGSRTRIRNRIYNIGIIHIRATDQATELEVVGEATLAGKRFTLQRGDVRLSGTSPAGTLLSRIVGDSTSAKLTVIESRIFGEGIVGNNQVMFDLIDSRIVANVPGSTLVFDPGPGGANAKDCSFRATNGSTLRIFDAMLRMERGDVNTEDGSTVEITDSTIQGGRGARVAASSGAVYLDNSVLKDVRLSAFSEGSPLENRTRATLERCTIAQLATFTGANGSETVVRERLAMEAFSVLTLNALNRETVLTVDNSGTGAVPITGKGTIKMSDVASGESPLSVIRGASSEDRLRLEDATRITGAGRIGANRMHLTLEPGAVIKATGTVPIIIDVTDPSRSFYFGTMTAAGAGGLVFADSRFFNQGRVEVFSVSQLKAQGSYIQTGGSTSVNGTLQANLIDIRAGELKGFGVLKGNLTQATLVKVQLAGTLRIGQSPGRLTIEGDYEQDFGGTLEVEIGGTAVADEYDQLVVTRDVDLGGTLILEFIDGFAPLAGQTFDFLTVGGVLNEHLGAVKIKHLASGFEFELADNGAGLTMTALNDGLYTPPGDCDEDGDVDLADYLRFTACFAGPGTIVDADCGCGDLDEDGDVDLADLIALLGEFTGAQ